MSLGCQNIRYAANLNVSFLSIRFPFTLPFFVFILFFLAGGALTLFTNTLLFTPAVPVSFFIPLLFLLVSAEDEEEVVWNYAD